MTLWKMYDKKKKCEIIEILLNVNFWQFERYFSNENIVNKNIKTKYTILHN